MIIVIIASSSLFAAIITLTICHFYYNNEITDIQNYYRSMTDPMLSETYRSGWQHGMADTTIENMGPISDDTIVMTLAY